MPLPGKTAYSVNEAALRWGCSPSQVVDFALGGQVPICASLPPVRAGAEILAGIYEVAADQLLRLAPLVGQGVPEVRVARVRARGSEEWRVVDAVMLTQADLLVMADDAQKFECECQLFGKLHNIGRPREFAWEEMLISMMIRVHEQGVPETQADWVRELVEWFERRSADGAAVPDESSIRKKIGPIWKALRGG